MIPSGWKELVIAAIVVLFAALFPFAADGYWLSIGVTAMMYTALCTSWALFSGPTHYISLASGAFFGVGGYLVAAGMSDYGQSFWLMAAIAPVIATILAAAVGFATLRLSGVYFVIFTLGLAEMVRNLVSWVQNNFLGSRGLYVLTDFSEAHIYWMLLVIAASVYLLGWFVSRSRLGFAMRIIGNDEIVAKHVGINTATSKVILFMTTGFFAALVWSSDCTTLFLYRAQSGIFTRTQFYGGHHGFTWRCWKALGPLVGVIPFT